MGLFNSATSGLKASSRPRGTSMEDKMPEDTEPDDTSILFVSSSLSATMFHYSTHDADHDDSVDSRDENEGSIILSLISQLRYAACLLHFCLSLFLAN